MCHCNQRSTSAFEDGNSNLDIATVQCRKVESKNLGAWARVSMPGMADKPNVTPPKTPLVKGSCLCRRIQYELNGAPSTTVLCHCDNCRRACGSCFAANGRYAKEQLTITQGQDVLRTFDDAQTDSGSTIHRSFCGTCGSPLFITHSEYTDMVSVALGSMEDQQQ